MLEESLNGTLVSSAALQEAFDFIPVLNSAQVDGIGESAQLFANLVLRKRETLCSMVSSAVSPARYAQMMFAPVLSGECFDPSLLRHI